MTRILFLRHSEYLEGEEGLTPTIEAKNEWKAQRDLLASWSGLASSHPGHINQSRYITGSNFLGDYDEMGDLTKSQHCPPGSEFKEWYTLEARRKGIDRAALFYDGTMENEVRLWGEEGVDCLTKQGLLHTNNVLLVTHGVRLATMLRVILDIPMRNFESRNLNLKLGEGVLLEGNINSHSIEIVRWTKLGRIKDHRSSWSTHLNE